MLPAAISTSNEDASGDRKEFTPTGANTRKSTAETRSKMIICPRRGMQEFNPHPHPHPHPPRFEDPIFF